VIIRTQSAAALLKVNDGIVFDEGHPEQDEQGGRVQAVIAISHMKLEIVFSPGSINLSAIRIGAIVWKTDDPAVRRDLEQSYSRDLIPNRVPLNVTVRAVENQPLRLRVSDGESEITLESAESMQRAQKHPLSEQLFREQFGRLGNTPFTLAEVKITGPTGDDAAHPIMTPKSLLNDLRRQAVEQLLKLRSNSHCITNPGALDTLRVAISSPQPRTVKPQPALTVLVRTLEQLRAAVLHSPCPSLIYCDFEDIRRYKEAVALARDAGQRIALATLRIIKPTEEGLLRQIADNQPDAILVRNLAALSFYREHAPEITLLGDYSMNVSNELTAQILRDSGLARLVPSYDLNWKQLRALLTRIDPGLFEIVIHQHMPMFHMEHCVFAHTLSDGKDYRTCGRPCDHHQLDLRDRVGQSHPLIPDVGCRNTVFNAQAQSAAEFIPKMLGMGLGQFRIELLREKGEDVGPLIERYEEILAARVEPKAAVRSLRVLNQLGVTSGTLARD
jgi:putative protease